MAVAKAKLKTDKVDAAISAQLLAGRLPAITRHTQPPCEIAQIADATLYTRSRSPTQAGLC